MLTILSVAFSQLWPNEVFPGDRIHSPVSTPFSHTTTHNVLQRNWADTQCVTRTNYTKTYDVLNTDTPQHTMCYIETWQIHNVLHGQTEQRPTLCYKGTRTNNTWTQCVKYKHTYPTQQHTTTHNVLHVQTAQIYTMCYKRTQANNTKAHNVLNTNTQQHTMCYIETRQTHNGQTPHRQTDLSRNKAIAIVAIFIYWYYLNPILASN